MYPRATPSSTGREPRRSTVVRRPPIRSRPRAPRHSPAAWVRALRDTSIRDPPRAADPHHAPRPAPRPRAGETLARPSPVKLSPLSPFLVNPLTKPPAPGELPLPTLPRTRDPRRIAWAPPKSTSSFPNSQPGPALRAPALFDVVLLTTPFHLQWMDRAYSARPVAVRRRRWILRHLWRCGSVELIIAEFFSQRRQAGPVEDLHGRGGKLRSRGTRSIGRRPRRTSARVPP